MPVPPRPKQHRVRTRTWVVLGAALGIAVIAVGTAWILRSRFVAERRAASLVRRAEAHLAAHELAEARRDLRAALRLQPDAAGPRHQLAVTELSLGDWDLAFLEFQSLTETHPEDPRGWIGLADLMLRTGLLVPPEAALDSAVAADPKRAEARRLRADVRLRLGRYHGALVDAEAAVAGAPRDPASWALLVRSAARSRGVDAGIEAARRGIAAVGQDPALVRLLAWLLAEQGHVGDAVAMLQEALRARGDPAERLTLARIALRANDPQAARKHLDELLAQRPADEEVLALRSVIDAAGGRVETTLALLAEAVQRLPRSRLLHELQASMNAARSDRAAVAALVAETVGRELGPPPAPSARVRAEAWMSSDDPARRARALARSSRPDAAGPRGAAAATELDGAQGIVDCAQSLPGHRLRGVPRGHPRARAGKPGAGRAPVLGVPLARASLSGRPRGAGQDLVASERRDLRRRPAQRVAERDPPFALARYLAARAYLDGRDPSRAEAALQHGLQGPAGSAATYRHLASFDLEVDRASDASEVCRRGVQRFPEYVSLLLTLSRLRSDSAGPRGDPGATRCFSAGGPTSTSPSTDLAELVSSDGGVTAGAAAIAPRGPRWGSPLGPRPARSAGMVGGERRRDRPGPRAPGGLGERRPGRTDSSVPSGVGVRTGEQERALPTGAGSCARIRTPVPRAPRSLAAPQGDPVRDRRWIRATAARAAS